MLRTLLVPLALWLLPVNLASQAVTYGAKNIATGLPHVKTFACRPGDVFDIDAALSIGPGGLAPTTMYVRTDSGGWHELGPARKALRIRYFARGTEEHVRFGIDNWDGDDRGSITIRREARTNLSVIGPDQFPDGSVRFGYRVNGVSWSTDKRVEVKLFHARGAKKSDILPGAAVAVRGLRFQSGSNETFTVSGSARAAAPAEATHWAVVIDSDDLVPETNESDNFMAAAHAPTRISARFLDAVPARVQPTVLLRAGYALKPRRYVKPLPIDIRMEGDVNPGHADYIVRATVVADEKSGGHAHGGSGRRPTGWLYARSASSQRSELPVREPLAARAPGGNPDAKAIEVSFDITDTAAVLYLAPEIAQNETLRFEVVHRGTGASVASLEHRIGVRFRPRDPTTGRHVDLVEIPPAESSQGGPLYVLYSSKPAADAALHPSRHFVSPIMLETIRAAGVRYREAQQSDPALLQAIAQIAAFRDGKGRGYSFPAIEPLFLNDASLPGGGLFDVGGDFAPPHGGHRFGDQIDVRTRHLVKDVDKPAGLPPSENRAARDRSLAALVRSARLRRFELLSAALTGVGLRFAKEGRKDHLHAGLPVQGHGVASDSP